METELEAHAGEFAMKWMPGDSDPMNWDEETFREHGAETPAARQLFLREFAHTLEARDMLHQRASAEESDREYSRWVCEGRF